MSPDELKRYLDEVNALIVPTVQTIIEYRIYYNQLGEIISCSMTQHPDYGDYIVVTQSEYDRYFDYRIVNGKLKKIDRDAGYRVKLEKSNRGYSVVKNHAGLLIEPEETYITTEHYAHRNN